MTRLILTFLHEDDGATALEYGLIVALLSAGVIIAMTAAGDGIAAVFQFIVDTVAAAVATPAPGNG